MLFTCNIIYTTSNIKGKSIITNTVIMSNFVIYVFFLARSICGHPLR